MSYDQKGCEIFCGFLSFFCGSATMQSCGVPWWSCLPYVSIIFETKEMLSSNVPTLDFN